MNNLFEIFQYSFMVRAFLAGSVVAIIAPLIGNFLVVRKLSLIADTLSHVALAGVSIGILFGWAPLPLAALSTVLAAILIEKMGENKTLSGDAILAILLPGGLAISLILLSLSHGVNTNMMNYLFGSITTVNTQELLFIGILGIITVATVAFLYNTLLFTSFDEDGAQVRGIPVKRIHLILTILTALTVSLAMRVVGVLLIGALMIVPVISAIQIGKSFIHTVIVSMGYGVVSVVVGLFLSYYLSLPAGATIVLFSLLLFCASLAYVKLTKKHSLATA